MSEIRNFFEKIIHTKGLLVILLLGIVLMVMPGNSGRKETKSEALENSTYQDRREYEKELEGRLCKILSTLDGVENVSVMITLKDSGERYYAKNENTDVKNAEDSSCLEKSQKQESALAFKNDAGGGQSPIYLKSATPKISGVLVTAKGVSNTFVQVNVLNAVKAVLDVPTHRIAVLEKS